MTTHPKCGKSWTGYRAEHCPVCCQTFTGTEAGDLHRVGDHNDGTRRCLTPEEMRNHPRRPMVQDDRGYWRVDRPRRSADSWSVSEPGAPSGGLPGVPGTPRPQAEAK